MTVRRAAFVCCFLLSPLARQAGAQTPDYSGNYTGTYSYTVQTQTSDPAHPGCKNLVGTVSSTGPFEVAVQQSGNSVIGTLTAHNATNVVDDGQGNCSLVRSDLTGTGGGTLNGNVVTGSAGSAGTITITFSGNSLSGSIVANTTNLTFTAVKAASGPASITSFTANPATVTTGSPSSLTWDTVNATSVSIDNGIGSQAITGNVRVAPKQTTTYTLTAIGGGATVTATTTVTVIGTGPRVFAGTLPSGMLQASGEGLPYDSFSVSNVGSDPANVTVTSSGSFFLVAPRSFILAPGGSQSITIAATRQSGGAYDGSISIAGDGISSPVVVPVHLLVAPAPAGTVKPQPAVARVDVSAPANQNPSGSITFTNSGSSTMNGIAVADVPWLEPQTGAITIAPGQTQTVTFAVDRTKRPDAAALFGAAGGTILLRFLGAPVSSQRVASGTTPTSTVSVSVVDVVKPAVAAGSPPPLAGGEVALLIAGHGSASGIAGDLLLGNRGTAAVPDLKLFLTAASQIATLPQLAANLGLTLPSVSTSIFDIEAPGTIMLRGSIDQLAVAALRMVNPANAAAYFSTTPVFRSDRGMPPGGRIVLSGVENSDTARTNIFVQELSGNSGTADIQSYDDGGAPIGAKNSVSMSPFVSVSDQVSVVPGARSVVITNTSQGSTRINAYARVISLSTSDSWSVVDPSATVGTSNTFIMPMVASPAVSGATDLYVTNTSSSSPTTATLDVITPSTRRRAIRLASNGPDEGSQSTLTIRPHETQRTSISPETGFIRISGSFASVSAAGRVTMTSNGRFGSALPVMPIESAFGPGIGKRFANVGDSSAKTIAAGTPATFRSSLLLIDPTGQPATVRVTLWYSLSAGVAVSSQAVSSREFTVGANQMLLISDLARTVIGPQRDAYGDLRDMQVDVDVISGAGRILPFIESVDNGTGDPVVRSD